MSTIVAIVEGPGEVDAIPILIRRIAATVLPGTVPQVRRPIRVKRDRFLKESGLERYVDLAARQSGPDGRVLIVLDGDDDCPSELAATILHRATSARSDRHIKVVLAKREYEAWFLAAADSIAGRRGLPDDITAPDDAEAIRNAKGWLRRRSYATFNDMCPSRAFGPRLPRPLGARHRSSRSLARVRYGYDTLDPEAWRRPEVVGSAQERKCARPLVCNR